MRDLSLILRLFVGFPSLRELLWEQGDAGSNPAAPIRQASIRHADRGFLLIGLQIDSVKNSDKKLALLAEDAALLKAL